MVAVTMKITAAATALALLATPIMAVNPNHVVERQAAVAGAPQNPAGAGNGQGKQFIGGACKSSKDCAENANPQAACARLEGNSEVGQCSGICVTFAAPKAGGGFGDATAPKIRGGLCADQQPLIDAAFAKAQGAANGQQNGQNGQNNQNPPQCTGNQVNNNPPAVNNNPPAVNNNPPAVNNNPPAVNN